MIAALAIAAVALALAFVAAPGNDWYLPGQTVTLKTAVENRLNGHLVFVGVADDGSTASIAVNTSRNDHAVVPGDAVRLGFGQNLRVVRIVHVPVQSGGEPQVGGVGTVVVRIVPG